MFTLYGIIIAVFVLSIIIFIHELGHFLAARKSGIRVEKFSLGFGPKLIGIKRGETEYQISVLPFGGYVKMPGEDPRERTGEPGEFSSAPIKNRIFVAAAGPAMNFLLGILMFYCLYLIGVEVPSSTQTTEIGYVVQNTPAKAAGIQAGDQLFSINGNRVEKWDDVKKMIYVHPGEKVHITLKRNGKKIEKIVIPEMKTKKGLGEYGIIGVSPRTEIMVEKIVSKNSPNVDIKSNDIIKSFNGQPISHYEDFYGIAAKNPGKEVNLELIRDGKKITTKLNIDIQIEVMSVQAETPAAKAGLLPGDRILTVNGKTIRHYSELQELIKSNPNQTISFGIKREDELMTLNLIPETDESGELKSTGFSIRETVSGILLGEPMDVDKYNIISAFGKGVERSWNTVVEVFWVVKALFTREISPRYLSGPVGIVNITARVAKGGIRGLLFITAFISINLGIVNLLPIPIADGGQILFFMFEKVRGKPLSVKKQLIIQQVGIALLIAFFVYITYNDILRFI